MTLFHPSFMHHTLDLARIQFKISTDFTPPWQCFYPQWMIPTRCSHPHPTGQETDRSRQSGPAMSWEGALTSPSIISLFFNLSPYITFTVSTFSFVHDLLEFQISHFAWQSSIFGWKRSPLQIMYHPKVNQLPSPSVHMKWNKRNSIL